jgi:hypothetical protein
VRGLPNTEPSWVYGNFLYILYEEEEVAATYGGCTSGKNQLAWGGPTRIRAIPLLAFADTWPNEKDGPIILAQVELGPGCAVAQIHNQVRKYVDAARPTTRTVSYEGDKDLVKDQPKRLSFHVIGGPAKSVTLYLWAAEISSLLYTQLAPHSHAIPVLETGSQLGDTSNLSHKHDLDMSQVTVDEESPVHGEKHDVLFPFRGPEEAKNEHIKVGKDQPEGDLKIVDDLGGAVTGGAHTHPLVVASGDGKTLATTEPVGDLSFGSHHHETERDTTGATGQGERADVIEGGLTDRLSCIDDLQVYLDDDPTPITAQILAQLGAPANGWDKLGDGTSAHRLVTEGTGPIALERIRALNQGEHTLEFKVENASGGNLRYNLYVE